MLPFLRARPKAEHLEDFSLRRFQPSDKREVIDLIQKRFEDIGMSLDLDGDDKDLTDIERYWQDAGGDFMLLFRQGKVVGTIAVQPLENESRTARFSWYFLKHEVEGKGVSIYLLKWGLEWCIKHMMRSIELWTGEKRWWVHKIYGKFGFKHIGITAQRAKGGHLLHSRQLNLAQIPKLLCRAVLDELTVHLGMQGGHPHPGAACTRLAHHGNRHLIGNLLDGIQQQLVALL